MESKEALENWYNTQSPSTKAYEYELHYRLIKKDLDRLEKQDKVIEILKNKPFSFNQFALNMIDNVEEYNSFIKIESDKYTQEEYNLLKEVFGNEEIHS